MWPLIWKNILCKKDCYVDCGIIFYGEINCENSISNLSVLF